MRLLPLARFLRAPAPSTRALALLLGAAFGAACSPSAPGAVRMDASGVYTRAGFHFVLQCANDPIPHIVEYIYPANVDVDTFTIADEDGVLTVAYGAAQIGTGTRDGRRTKIHLTSLDGHPGSAVDWTLEGTVETSLPYHSRLFTGHLDPAVIPGITVGGGACVFDEKSVFWWAEEPDGDLGPEPIGSSDPAAVTGDFTLFAWWANMGSISQIPGRGPDRADTGSDLISLAISTQPQIVQQGGELYADDHLAATPGRGVGDGRALWFRQADHSRVDITAAQAVVVNDTSDWHGLPGVRRLMVGWLAGRLFIDPAGYAPGTTGPMGWTDIARPGIVFWEEVDYGSAAAGAGAGAGAGSFAPSKKLDLRVGNIAARQTIVDGIPRGSRGPLGP